MIRPLYSFLLLFIVLLSGCSGASSSDTVPKEKSYVSVYEYFDEFTGENLKTSVLQITKTIIR